jgi:hypothetical protein
MISLFVPRNKFLYFSKIFSLISLLILFVSCGAVSTSDRYESSGKDSKKSESEKNKTISEIESKETFDLKPYHPEISLEEKEIVTKTYSPNSDAWYEYENKQESNKKIIGTQDGYRVQVIATDDLDEANSVNNEISSQISNQKTYVNFEPPFYKVKLGDFLNSSEANDMRFRLSQMGFTESKVVRETVNIFE